MMEENFKPNIGMKFDNLEDAWSFWVAYGGKAGFGVRKDSHCRSRKDNTIITSQRYVCSKEGFREEKKGANPKNPRAETRTGCMARIALKREGEKYIVYQFIEAHNHVLHILRPWTKEARAGVISDASGGDIVADPKLEITHRFRDMSQEAISIAAEAAKSAEACLVFRSLMAEARQKVSNVLHSSSSTEDTDLNATSIPTSQCTSQATGFKEKEGLRNKNCYRSCIEVQQMKKRREPTRMNVAQCGLSCSAPFAPHAHTSEMSFNEMLMAPIDHSISSLDALQVSPNLPHTDS